ncbi:hypothetical protein [Sphingobium yanoikuyae]|nr:hypothetical protein [Sphingobium yanoikuyae]
MTIEQEFASSSANSETVYAAIELSKKNWVISVAHPASPSRAFIVSQAAILMRCWHGFARLPGRSGES